MGTHALLNNRREEGRREEIQKGSERLQRRPSCTKERSGFENDLPEEVLSWCVHTAETGIILVLVTPSKLFSS